MNLKKNTPFLRLKNFFILFKVAPQLKNEQSIYENIDFEVAEYK